MINKDRIIPWLENHKPSTHAFDFSSTHLFLFLGDDDLWKHPEGKPLDDETYMNAVRKIERALYPERDAEDEELLDADTIDSVIRATGLFHCRIDCPAWTGAQLITDVFQRLDFCRSIGGCQRFMFDWIYKEYTEDENENENGEE